MFHMWFFTVHTSYFEIFHAFICMFDGLALPFIALSEIISQADRSQEPGRVALEKPASENLS